MSINKFIPLSIPNFEGNEKKYVNEALDEGWVSTGGAYISRFEENLAFYLHTEKVACLQSGTSALHLSLIQIGVTSNDAVIVPTVTFIAAVNPVKYMYAEPIFIDADDSLCMDPIKLKKFCEDECSFENGKLLYNGKHIKALIVVHVFGNLADMDSIMDTALKYNIKVIEDSTEAIGTRYVSGKFKGKYAGTIGDYGCYSFNGNKIITTGGGGAVTSKDPKSVMHMKFLSTQAKTDAHNYIHDEIGYNYRMTNLQAALGVAQLEKLDEFIERKHSFHKIYCKEFNNYEYGNILSFREGTISNQWFLSLCLNIEKLDIDLFGLIEELKLKNVETRPIWGLIHKQKPYLNCYCYMMEKALYYYNRVINIPSSTNLNSDDIVFASKVIRDVISKHIK